MGRVLKNSICLEMLGVLMKLPSRGWPFLKGSPKTINYVCTLKIDVLGTARKLIAACHISRKCWEDFVDTVFKGNCDDKWTEIHSNVITRKTYWDTWWGRKAKIDWWDHYYYILQKNSHSQMMRSHDWLTQTHSTNTVLTNSSLSCCFCPSLRPIQPQA